MLCWNRVASNVWIRLATELSAYSLPLQIMASKSLVQGHALPSESTGVCKHSSIGSSLTSRRLMIGGATSAAATAPPAGTSASATEDVAAVPLCSLSLRLFPALAAAHSSSHFDLHRRPPASASKYSCLPYRQVPWTAQRHMLISHTRSLQLDTLSDQRHEKPLEPSQTASTLVRNDILTLIS